MAKSEGSPEGDENGEKEPCASGSVCEQSYDDHEVLRTLAHPLRRQVLRSLHCSPERPQSPAEIEVSLVITGKPENGLSTVSYHVRQLAKAGAISLVEEKPVRGATEHFYVSEVLDAKWVWDLLERTQKRDETMVWPKSKRQRGKKTAKKKRQ